MMKRLPVLRRAIACIIFLELAACGPVPGGALNGVAHSAPNDWTSVLETERTICEIESRPTNPHSIQLDCFLFDGQVHVQSHRWALDSWWPVESWAAIWILEPDIKLRIDQRIFELRAVHLSNPAERTEVLTFRGYDPVPEGIAVFRFGPRT